MCLPPADSELAQFLRGIDIKFRFLHRHGLTSFSQPLGSLGLQLGTAFVLLSLNDPLVVVDIAVGG
jgi:hypothetical protein